MFLDFWFFFNELLAAAMTELFGLTYFVSKQLKYKGLIEKRTHFLEKKRKNAKA